MTSTQEAVKHVELRIDVAQKCARCGNKFFHWYDVALCDECDKREKARRQ